MISTLRLDSLAKVLGGHLCGEHRARALEVGVDARHVIHDADTQRAADLGRMPAPTAKASTERRL